MNDIQSLIDLPQGFDGRVRLFPLPNLVMFPHVLQPLHIFEPRYCDLLAEALESDQLITMATLHEGWEADTHGRPPISAQVCIGKILMHTPVEGGRHNILLLGVRRGKILKELSTTSTFRSAYVELMVDQYRESGLMDRERLKLQLLAKLQQLMVDVPAMRENLRQLAEQHLLLGPITDLVAFTAALQVTDKLALLGEADVDQRAQRLLPLLQQLQEPASLPKVGGFPPAFSDN